MFHQFPGCSLLTDLHHHPLISLFHKLYQSSEFVVYRQEISNSYFTNCCKVCSYHFTVKYTSFSQLGLAWKLCFSRFASTGCAIEMFSFMAFGRLGIRQAFGIWCFWPCHSRCRLEVRFIHTALLLLDNVTKQRYRNLM